MCSSNEILHEKKLRSLVKKLSKCANIPNMMLMPKICIKYVLSFPQKTANRENWDKLSFYFSILEW